MPKNTPYRSLGPEGRTALLTAAMKKSKELRAIFIQRMVERPGGFRAVTLQSWPVDKLAKEIVRLNAEKPQDEFDLLHFLYVEHAPQIQVDFLDAAGVKHENGAIDETLEVPYATEESVKRAAAVVKGNHEADGERYLRTLAKYAPAAWPGIQEFAGSED